MKNKLNITAPVNNLGYGVFSVETALAFERMDYKPSLFPINNQIDVPKEQYNDLLPMLRRQEDFYPDGNSLRIWHQYDMAHHVGKGVKAGYTFFEVDKLNKREVNNLNSLDCVFVSSKWYKEICINNGIQQEKINIARPGVNPNNFNSSIEPAFNFKDATVFLNIGKWEIRKGHDVLANAFNKAFNADDNVILIMCCFNPLIFNGFDGPKESLKWTEYYKSTALGKVNKILVVQQRLRTQTELCSIINSADYGVFPSRAEGWNLDAAEILACGKQCILTDFSAHTEFIKDSNSEDLSIKIDKVEPAYDGVFFDYGDVKNEDMPMWGKFDESAMSQLIESLRKCHRQKQDKIVKKVVGFAEKYSWENTAKEIDKGISKYE